MLRKRSLDQSGIAHLMVIIVIVLVVVVGFAGWRIGKGSPKQEVKQSASTTQNTNTTQASTELTNYRDDNGKFSLQYPKNWTIKTDKNSSYGAIQVTTIITTSSGAQLHLNSTTGGGGRGGDCTPEPGDKPFAPTNGCATIEYLSKEPTSTASALVTTGKYGVPAGSESPEIQYFINIEFEGDYKIELNKPVMGLVSYTGAGTSDIWAVSSDASFLTSADAQAIKTALKSIKFD